LFPKTKVAVHTNSKIKHFGIRIWFLACLIGAAGYCFAQDTIYPSHSDPEEPASPAREENNVIPIPIRGGEINPSEARRQGKIQSRGAQNFEDEVFSNPRNGVGFALNASQGYIFDISEGGNINPSSPISFFSGSLFFNADKRRSSFHMDFGAGSKIYYHAGDDNASRPTYNATVDYAYQISKSTSMRIADDFASYYNDYSPFTTLYSPLQDISSLSSEVVVGRQRIHRNSVTATISRRIGQKINLGLSGIYAFYKYAEENLDTTHEFHIEGYFDFRLTRWLALTNRYTAFLNSIDESEKQAQIHRLQVAGLGFNLGPYVRFWSGGGVSFSEYQEERHLAESINAGIGYTSLDVVVTLNYQRDFTSALGISRLMYTDAMTANVGWRITRWMNTMFESSYSKSEDQVDAGILETLESRGQFGFALNRNINLTLNAYYQNQKAINYSISGLGIERVSAYLDLQYVWPSRGRTD
jgi:hypothetical protein